jgi:DNA modification methylase
MSENRGQQSVLADTENDLLSVIEQENAALFDYFSPVIQEYSYFSRSLVSFQANKQRPAYRWYKFKEAFSASLIEFLIEKANIETEGILLDPFAGSGTTLFVAQALGFDVEGIELLPIGQKIIQARIAVQKMSPILYEQLKKWTEERPWEQVQNPTEIEELRITLGAYSETTKKQIEQYLMALRNENSDIQPVLLFALLCVLESVSYTRKDGQYLRWDYRSGRKNGIKPFDKGDILSFQKAITNKLHQILKDIKIPASSQDLFSGANAKPGTVFLHSGSCMDVLPALHSERFDAIITSPPYCNRYDYTRTYALELALLGTTEKELSSLRQNMLSCTVENREKDLIQLNPSWETAVSIAQNQPLLQSILNYLEQQKDQKKLNNNGIPRMVRGYFYEMACVIQECFRALKKGTPLIMVNDNVRYAGVGIAVDTILSKIAEDIGFRVEKIYVLPGSKGNSSQQMGSHGRQPLRKCVYIWRKP